MPKAKRKGKGSSEDSTTRIAVVNEDRCKPKKCALECSRNCPVNRQGKICIEVKKSSKVSLISEVLCIGCNICVKKCPFEAITIINLPSNLDSCTTHRFGPNSFKLHRLPTPRSSQVLGLVGTNGIGKSTALKILSGTLKPNLGQFRDPPSWAEIIKYYRGSELQGYLQRILDDELSAVMKPQYVDHIPKKMKAAAIKKGKVDDAGKPVLPKVKEVLKKKDSRDVYKEMLLDLDLKHIRNRQMHHLSGGELQRLAIALCAIRDEDVYMFDEPSSYLDVKQRLKAGAVIRSLVSAEEDARRTKLHGAAKSAYVICVEHDLAILDYLSDFVCVLYGTPGVFGVVTMPFSVREGINVFLAGHIPTENMRFREFELNFKVSDTSRTEEGEMKTASADTEDVPPPSSSKKKKKKGAATEEKESGGGGGKKRRVKEAGFHYPMMVKKLDTFSLTVERGYFRDSEIVVMLGENGTGKTTFVKMLAGLMKPEPDEDGIVPEIPELGVSYKPQAISPSFEGTVHELLMKRIRSNMMHPAFQTDVYKPMCIKELEDRRVTTLSGGELQRVAIVLALGLPADVYLIDEPSAYLDSEQRIVASKVIKRYILHAKKAAFVVEHDFIMATYLADRVIVFDGVPGKETCARAPQSLLGGMNNFLQQLDVTFRRDPTNYRPRINKRGSQKDQEQKAGGNYFFLDADD